MRQSLQADPGRGKGPWPADQEPKRRGRLLVAEDAKCMQEIISSILGTMGLEADIVENGQAACEMAEKSKAAGNPYDLILMDMKMPHMNGYEAVRWLRKHGWEGPIVAATACATAEDRTDCLDAGCDDYLSKPFSKTALKDVVTQQLSGTATIQSAVDFLVRSG
jgi:CheY-like chemotaxis protein